MGKIMKNGIELSGSSNSAENIKYDETKNAKEAIDETGRRLDNKLANGVANPNLLINADFCNPVNQREYVSGTEISGFTIDRWRCAYTTLNLLDGYISVSINLSKPSWFTQWVEFPEKRKGYYTVSIKYRTSSNDLISWFQIKDSDMVVYRYVPSKNFIGDGEWHILTYTVNIGKIDKSGNLIDFLPVVIGSKITYDTTEGHDDWYVDIPSEYSEGQSTIDIEWVKCEEGIIATPFRSRLYAEELTLCKRYFERIKGMDEVNNPSSVVGIRDFLYDLGTGIMYTDTLVGMAVRFQEKRKTPTVTTSSDLIMDGWRNKGINASNVQFGNVVTQAFWVYMTLDSTELSTGQCVGVRIRKGYIDIDAEL